MKLMRRMFLFILPAAALLLNGCYNRWTGNYAEFPELEYNRSAVLETSDSSEEEALRLKKLEELEKEPEKVYTLNAGDNIAITVYNHSDLNIKTTITPDGYIGMVFIGQIKVAGLTIVQATEAIEQKLSKYIRNPKVGISPYEIKSETVTIAGAVARPGMYDITNGMRLADLFAKAGGAASHYYDGQTLDAADFDKSIFIRHGEIVPLNFGLAISTGVRPHNVLLRKGDYIYIAPRAESMVYLIGDAKKPYRQIWSKQLGLLELMSIAGWMNETYWDHAIIIRGGIAHPKMYKVDLDGILTGKKSNVLLEAGDIVYIPKDNISEYNVFIRKLLPTGQLLNMLTTPMSWYSSLRL